MEKLINVLVIGRVPIICSAIENTITKKFTESFVMISSQPSEVIDLNDIVSFNLIIIDSDDYTTEELISLREIKKMATNSKIIVFSFNEDTTYINWCFKNGANALLSKYSSEEDIIRTINIMLNGKNHFINDLKIRVPSPRARKELKLLATSIKTLSSREIEIASLIAKGHKNKFISSELNIKQSSVSTYKKRILMKTSCSSVFELVNKLQKVI